MTKIDTALCSRCIAATPTHVVVRLIDYPMCKKCLKLVKFSSWSVHQIMTTEEYKLYKIKERL